MTGYIFLTAAIIILMVIGFIRAKNEKRREFEEKLKEQTMPSGKVLPIEETILALTAETLEAILLLSNEEYENFLEAEQIGKVTFDDLPKLPDQLTGEQRLYLRRDLDWLVNYAGHRLPEEKKEGDPWIHLYTIGSRVKNKYHWIV